MGFEIPEMQYWMLKACKAKIQATCEVMAYVP
jgi:hypothetical protein